VIRGLGVTVLSAIVLAGCGTAQRSLAIDPGNETFAPSPSASPRPAPASSPASTGQPSPVPAVPSASPWTSATDSLEWHRLGTIRASDIDGIVGFANGYVALEGAAGAAWYSADGRSWNRTRLPIEGSVENALDANGRLGRIITTNGRDVLIVGGYSTPPCGLTNPGDTGGGPDCAVSPIAWLSDDGRTWHRSVATGPGGEFVAAWPVAIGGWTAAVSDWSGEDLAGDRLRSSGDGSTWKSAPKPAVSWEGYDHAPLGVASRSGQSLLAASERGGSKTTVAMMDVGGSWLVLDGFPGTGVEVFAGVAPAEGRSRWVLGGASGCVDIGNGCTGGPVAWSSVDGADWKTNRLPTGPGVPGADPPVVVSAVTSLAVSERGFVVVGADGSSSEGARHETWVSDDGDVWALLPQASRPRFDYGPGLVAAGPSGVIGISKSKSEKEQTAWQLR
jgi:hypothetical protein